MDLFETISNNFAANIKTTEATLLKLQDPIAQASEAMSSALLQGHKILACGNGGSASDAQHFSAELVVRFNNQKEDE